MKKRFLLIFLITTSMVLISKGQSPTGLWQFKSVVVGDRIKTPVTKWTRINVDHTFQSGNGWLQNAEGSWTYSEETKLFLPTTANWIKDDAGPFKVSFENETMVWQREEEGQTVRLILAKIEHLPSGPLDKITGLWDLVDIEDQGDSTMVNFDPADKHYLFFRWDRIYQSRTPLDDKESGYWYMNAHSPELTLINFNRQKSNEKWTVLFSDSEMILSGSSKNTQGLKMTYQRIDEFPE